MVFYKEGESRYSRRRYSSIVPLELTTKVAQERRKPVSIFPSSCTVPTSLMERREKDYFSNRLLTFKRKNKDLNNGYYSNERHNVMNVCV